MQQLTMSQVSFVSGGIDSITPACFDAVNYYSEWWYYGQITSETFTSTFTNYCSPNTIVIVDSTGLDVIACVSFLDAIYVLATCYQ